MGGIEGTVALVIGIVAVLFVPALVWANRWVGPDRTRQDTGDPPRPNQAGLGSAAADRLN